MEIPRGAAVFWAVRILKADPPDRFPGVFPGRQPVRRSTSSFSMVLPTVIPARIRFAATSLCAAAGRTEPVKAVFALEYEADEGNRGMPGTILAADAAAGHPFEGILGDGGTAAGEETVIWKRTP